MNEVNFFYTLSTTKLFISVSVQAISGLRFPEHPQSLYSSTFRQFSRL